MASVLTVATVATMGMGTAFAATDSDSMTSTVIKAVKHRVTNSQDAEKSGMAKRVNMGNLAPEQMEALREGTQAELKAGLAELVAAGTITQEIADKLTTLPERGELVKKINGVDMANLTDEQKSEMKAKMEAGKAKRPEGDHKPGHMMMFKLEGLTDSQNQAIKTVMESAHKAAMTKLVSEGVITQEVADQMSQMVKVGPRPAPEDAEASQN